MSKTSKQCSSKQIKYKQYNIILSMSVKTISIRPKLKKEYIFNCQLSQVLYTIKKSIKNTKQNLNEIKVNKLLFYSDVLLNTISWKNK